MNTNTANPAVRDMVDPGLGTKRNPADARRVPLPHDAIGSDVDPRKDKGTKKKPTTLDIPSVSKATRNAVLIGATIALICAEAWSAPTLFSLALMARAPRQLAWLLPAVLDTYAATSIWFGNNLSRSHPAYRDAVRNTRRALLITVLANSVDHLLMLAGGKLPSWMPIVLLIVVTALPIYIADRLVHLFVLASGTNTPAPAPAHVPAQAAPARTPAAAAQAPARPHGTEPAENGTRPGTTTRTAPERASHTPSAAVPPNAGTRTPFGTWVDRAVPLWNAYVEKHGAEPIAAVLGNQVRLAHPEDPHLPTSDRWDRKLCNAVREAVADAGQGADNHDDESEAVNR